MNMSLVQTMMRQERRTSGSAKPAVAPAPVFGSPVVEMLWLERHEETFGDLLRVTVPLVGGITDGVAAAVQASLEHRWVVKGLLGEGAISSIAVELRDEAGIHSLVLLMTSPAGQLHPATDAHMCRDVRWAIRAALRYGATTNRHLAQAA